MSAADNTAFVHHTQEPCSDNIHSIGHNNPPITKAEFTGAIDLWVRTRDAAAALSREQIAKLEAFDRLDALRKAQILHLSRYYRDNPKADAAPGVLAIVYMMADDDTTGASTLSQVRIGQILGRSRDAIIKAFSRLESSGALSRVSRRGTSSMSVPVVPPELVCRNHRTWLVDALAPVARIATCMDDTTPPVALTPSPPVVSTIHHHVVSSIQVAKGGCSVVGVGPVVSTGHNFTKDSTTESLTRAGADGVVVDLATKRIEVNRSGRLVAVLSIMAILQTAQLLMVPEARAMAIAEREAHTWLAGAPLPDHPQKWVENQIRKDRINGQVDAVKVEIAQSWGKKPARQVSAPAPSDEQARAQRRKNYDMGERTAEQYLEQECIAKQLWTKFATHLWGTPEDCSAVLARLGVKDGEWKAWATA
jgi:hypothetical protein